MVGCELLDSHRLPLEHKLQAADHAQTGKVCSLRPSFGHGNPENKEQQRSAKTVLVLEEAKALNEDLWKGRKHLGGWMLEGAPQAIWVPELRRGRGGS